MILQFCTVINSNSKSKWGIAPDIDKTGQDYMIYGMNIKKTSQNWIICLILLCFSCNLYGPSTLNLKGIWCRMEDQEKVFLACDGRGEYWIHRSSAAGITTTIDGEFYEVVREDDLDYFHYRVDGAEYAYEIIAFIPGELLTMEGWAGDVLIYRFYHYCADYSAGYDVADFVDCDCE